MVTPADSSIKNAEGKVIEGAPLAANMGSYTMRRELRQAAVAACNPPRHAAVLLQVLVESAMTSGPRGLAIGIAEASTRRRLRPALKWIVTFHGDLLQSAGQSAALCGAVSGDGDRGKGVA